jgi:hypothetical protein
MRLPSDYTPEEYELFNYLTKGNDDAVDTSRIYQLLEDPIDKFLLCYIFEAKYTRRQAEKAIGLSKATIWARLKKIKRTIYNDAKTNHLIEMIDKL